VYIESVAKEEPMTGTSWQSYWANEANHEWWERPQPEVIAFIESQLPAARPMVLDLGCGIGRHAIAFALAGFNVTATDASAEAVCHLDNWAKELGLSVRTQICDSIADGFPPESFDIVLSYNVIYHGFRHQFAAAIGHVQKLLKPGGLFFFTCPTLEDGNYGRGEELAAHTFACENSIVPGDIHYFSDETDLHEMLIGFTIISLKKNTHYWENRGKQQFHSYWEALTQKK
jgi:tellurite methyltransferase